MLIYKNGVKNGVSTLLLFDKNGVPQHSLFDVKSENGVKNGVHTLFYMIANFLLEQNTNRIRTNTITHIRANEVGSKLWKFFRLY